MTYSDLLIFLDDAVADYCQSNNLEGQDALNTMERVAIRYLSAARHSGIIPQATADEGCSNEVEV